MTTTTAPPGWECQPEEPPTSKMFRATTTSVPFWRTRLPDDTSAPRANTVLAKSTGDVAEPGTATATANTSAGTRMVTARTKPRFKGLCMCAYFQRLCLVAWRRKGKHAHSAGRGSDPLVIALAQ